MGLVVGLSRRHRIVVQHMADFRSRRTASWHLHAASLECLVQTWLTHGASYTSILRVAGSSSGEPRPSESVEQFELVVRDVASVAQCVLVRGDLGVEEHAAIYG